MAKPRKLTKTTHHLTGLGHHRSPANLAVFSGSSTVQEGNIRKHFFNYSLADLGWKSSIQTPNQLIITFPTSDPYMCPSCFHILEGQFAWTNPYPHGVPHGTRTCRFQQDHRLVTSTTTQGAFPPPHRCSLSCGQGNNGGEWLAKIGDNMGQHISFRSLVFISMYIYIYIV